MGEKPHGITAVESITLHYLHSITFNPLKEDELMYSHLTSDVGEETKRDLNHRMKPDKPSDPGVHLLDGKGGVTAAEGMNPPAALNCISHYGSSLLNIIHLRFFNTGHDFPGILQPFIC